MPFLVQSGRDLEAVLLVLDDGGVHLDGFHVILAVRHV